MDLDITQHSKYTVSHSVPDYIKETKNLNYRCHMKPNLLLNIEVQNCALTEAARIIRYFMH